MGGLASENIRWAESVENYKSQGVTLCGDVLLISAFVSYVGYFTKKYRNELMEKFWIPYLQKLKVRGSSLRSLGRSPQGRRAQPNLPFSPETEAPAIQGPNGGPVWPKLTSIRAVGVAVSPSRPVAEPPVTQGHSTP